jgi:hypothetical protein
MDHRKSHRCLHCGRGVYRRDCRPGFRYGNLGPNQEVVGCQSGRGGKDFICARNQRASLAVPYRFPRYTPRLLLLKTAPLYRSSRPRSEAHSVILDGSERVCIGHDQAVVNQDLRAALHRPSVRFLLARSP